MGQGLLPPTATQNYILNFYTQKYIYIFTSYFCKSQWSTLTLACIRSTVIIYYQMNTWKCFTFEAGCLLSFISSLWWRTPWSKCQNWNYGLFVYYMPNKSLQTEAKMPSMSYDWLLTSNVALKCIKHTTATFHPFQSTSWRQIRALLKM